MKLDRIANVKGGMLQDHVKNDIARYLSVIKDGPIRIIITKYKRKRTLPQNRYYWGVVIKILSNHTGYTDDEMHDALKWLFLRVKRDGLPDTCGSTKKLNTDDFNEYLDKIKIWASTEMGCYIPDPEDG